ncbi:MAG: AMP-binding protein [Acidimicrobiia bacterium]
MPPTAMAGMSSAVMRVTEAGVAARTFAHVGLLAPIRPDRLLRMGRAVRHWGPTLAGGFALSAARTPERVAVVDERAALTFDELHRRTNALAHGLNDAGIAPGTTVAVLCRNHAGFVEATLALAKLGAHTVYLNTGFGGPQVRDVVAAERATAIVFDEEFRGVVGGVSAEVARFVAWHDGPVDGPTLDGLIGEGDESDPPSPERPGRTVMLTSGTTGFPRGVARAQTSGMGPGVALLSALPLRVGETTVVAAPMFHSWGLAHLALGLLLGSTLVVSRRFDPLATLEAVARHRASVLVAVPMMLQRILDLPETARAPFDTPSLRAVLVSGSSLPGHLAPRFMDAFGDVLYSLYGSTEVAYATVATPADLRSDPDTAGRPLHGTTIAVLDVTGAPVSPGERGRIFVANAMLFAGYTGGGTKPTVGGLMSTGDFGRLDAEGRLVVEGREDDMIVSGGENVFPEEVENLLADHDAIAEVAVVGVADAEFGQRLRAVVVRRPGSTLAADDVRAYVRANLARHKVPRDVEFRDELPRNDTGKVVRRRLGACGREGGPDAPGT